MRPARERLPSRGAGAWRRRDDSNGRGSTVNERERDFITWWWETWSEYLKLPKGERGDPLPFFESRRPGVTGDASPVEGRCSTSESQRG